MTDYFDELPSDPEAAFIFLEARFRADLGHHIVCSLNYVKRQHTKNTLGRTEKEPLV
ncbi:MAG: hypothetical protein OXC62_00765 [Aestuariivita sp.]|nr:hypothetical protein [Aestuariivita sp.]